MTGRTGRHQSERQQARIFGTSETKHTQGIRWSDAHSRGGNLMSFLVVWLFRCKRQPETAGLRRPNTHKAFIVVMRIFMGSNSDPSRSLIFPLRRELVVPLIRKRFMSFPVFEMVHVKGGGV